MSYRRYPPSYYYQPPKSPQQKRRDLIITLTIIALSGLFVVWVAASQPSKTYYTYTVVTPDDGDSYTGSGPGSSTHWVYGHGSPLPTMQPTATFHYGVNHNPWGYDFNPSSGQLLYSPVPGFCAGQYFHCVSDFWERSNGYVVECRNGLYSHSGGVDGACSRDGGAWRPLYSH